MSGSSCWTAHPLHQSSTQQFGRTSKTRKIISKPILLLIWALPIYNETIFDPPIPRKFVVTHYFKKWLRQKVLLQSSHLGFTCFAGKHRWRSSLHSTHGNAVPSTRWHEALEISFVPWSHRGFMKSSVGKFDSLVFWKFLDSWEYAPALNQQVAFRHSVWRQM